MIKFSIEKLSDELEKYDAINFAYLFGSSQDGIINDGSDVDVAIHLNQKNSLKIMLNISNIIEDYFKNVYDEYIRSDISILNTASSILGMEAIQGKNLFYKEEKKEEYLDFYSYTCRQYEDDIYWMEQQLKYRGY